jgi:hypothetical protein
MQHICTSCKHNFKVTRQVRLKTALGYQYFPWPIIKPSQSLDDYQKVKCPKCGQIDINREVKVYGLFQPRTFFFVFIGLIFLMLIADIFGLWPK